MKLLIKNIDEIYMFDEDITKKIKDGFIIIEDNIIKKIGEEKDLNIKESNFDQVIKGKDKIALPGLINAHTHAGMTLLRGYADDLPLDSWLKEKIWPFEAGLTAEDIYWGSMLAIMEMIKTGTTCFIDMYFQMERVAKAVIETGIRGVLTEGLIEANDGLKGLYEALNFAVNWQGQADGRITTMLAPHAPYSCSNAYLNKIKELAIENNLPINIHLAETKLEYKESIAKNGLSPVQHLAKLGLFDSSVIAAHCVYVDKDDINILADNNVGVAYNPCSNMKLGSGIAPIAEMLKAGINVGLGTDSVASNNNLDLIQEARIGSYLQKVNNLNPALLNTYDLLSMLTVLGARALKLNKLGLLKEGYQADVILIDTKEASMYYPHHNNLSNLFYAGSGRDVSTVIINGQVIMKDNDLLTIDQEKIYYEIEHIIKNKF